ncbi:MAG: hypothetical protein LUD72_12165 [Bacteroidales bacterium]|nr:hypothetical protein [Bacteroidales bacterium]
MILKPPEPYLYEWIVREETLNEERGIADEVKNLTTALANALIQDHSKDKGAFHETNTDNGQKIAYKCNTEGVRVSLLPILGVNKDVSLRYKVYLLDDPTTQKRNNNLNYVYYNSGGECDFDNSFIRLTTYIYNGTLGQSWVADIQHEAGHYFQNFKGQKKNDVLYQQVVDLVKSGNKNKMDVGWTLYYTFPTEQDAFANQFYRWLIDNKRDAKDLDFEEVLQNTEYGRFIKYAKRARACAENTINRIIRPLGFDNQKYRRRINTADKRFRRKMRNAFEKFLIDRKTEAFSDKHRDFNYS